MKVLPPKNLQRNMYKYGSLTLRGGKKETGRKVGTAMTPYSKRFFDESQVRATVGTDCFLHYYLALIVTVPPEDSPKLP